MYQPLAPCPQCRRHIRATESLCPFCASAMAPEALAAGVVPGAVGRLSRAAAFVFSTSVALAACEAGKTTPTPSGTAGAAGASGAAGVGGSAGAGPDDNGSVHAKYGGAPMPRPDDGRVDDHGAAAPKYGGAPLPRR